MLGRVLLSTILLALATNAGWNGQAVQRGSGIRLASAGGRNGTGLRGSGLKLNFSGRGAGSRSTTLPDMWNSSTMVAPTPPVLVHHESTHHSSNLYVGLVVPYKSFGVREYTKAVTSAKAALQRKLTRLFRRYDLQVHLSMKELTPSPTCKFLVLCLLVSEGFASGVFVRVRNEEKKQ